MNSTQLNCFVAVADSLSFARAAEKLHITQPAVTHQITSLENELDVKLFKRTTRTVELTREGFSFISDAKSILNTMSMAKIRFTTQKKEELTPFYIGCRQAELLFLPRLISEMAKQHPNIHPMVKTIPFPALLNHLQIESIDVVFGLQGTYHAKQNCKFHELAKIPISCVVPKDHPLAGKALITPKDLKEERIAILDTHNMPSPLLTVQSSLLKEHTSSNFYRCETTEDILLLLKAGMAVSFMPDIVPQREKDLVYIPVQESVCVSYGIYYKTLRQKPLIRDFIKIGEAYFRNAESSAPAGSTPL